MWPGIYQVIWFNPLPPSIFQAIWFNPLAFTKLCGLTLCLLMLTWSSFILRLPSPLTSYLMLNTLV